MLNDRLYTPVAIEMIAKSDYIKGEIQILKSVDSKDTDQAW